DDRVGRAIGIRPDHVAVLPGHGVELLGMPVHEGRAEVATGRLGENPPVGGGQREARRAARRVDGLWSGLLLYAGLRHETLIAVCVLHALERGDMERITSLSFRRESLRRNGSTKVQPKGRRGAAQKRRRPFGSGACTSRSNTICYDEELRNRRDPISDRSTH